MFLTLHCFITLIEKCYKITFNLLLIERVKALNFDKLFKNVLLHYIFFLTLLVKLNIFYILINRRI